MSQLSKSVQVLAKSNLPYMPVHANPNPSAADLMSKQTFSPLVLWFPSPFTTNARKTWAAEEI